MESSSLKRYAPYALAVGGAGLLVAAVVALLYRQFNTAVQVSLVVGLIGFVVAILFSPGSVSAWFGLRQARYGSNALVMTLAFFGIVILVNYLVTRNSVRWDLSEDQINTLAPETIAALQALPQPVKAVGFYSSNLFSQQQSTTELLRRYQVEADGKLTYEFFDPVGDPVTAREYNITRDGTLILEMGDQREEISFASETEITSALVRFASPSARSVYFLTGHGERDPQDTADSGLSVIADLLAKQNYEIKTLNLQVTDTVPADARAVVIVGPLQPLSQAEVDTLGRYLQQPNSALMALLDPPAQTQAPGETVADPLAEYLQTAWSITARNDVVVDFANSFPNQPLFPLNAGYESHPITDRLQNISTVFPVARSLEITTTNTSLTLTPLVKTAAGSWGETEIDSLNSDAGPVAGAGDPAGPLTLAVAAANSTTKARVVIFGDSDFAGNGAASQGANANLVVNALNWATLDETLISLVAKVPTERTLQLLDALTANTIFFVTVIAMPLAVVVLGGVVWFIRRRHV